MNRIFDAYISSNASEHLRKLLGNVALFKQANELIFSKFHIKNFFGIEADFTLFKQLIAESESLVSEPDRAEYGDFQTNQKLAEAVTEYLKRCNVNPKVIIEPSCGKGSFLLAALSSFSGIEKILAVEIYKPYTWEAKFSIIDFLIRNPLEKVPEIEIHHFNVFEFDFKHIAKSYLDKEVLVLGNPPWVTNSKLSSLDSGNLPQKSNFKNEKGFDALTGKGNFDIGEYISLMMFDAFQKNSGHFAFLVKNAVIKNALVFQNQRRYALSDFRKLGIDSKREFNVSVEASLFFCKLNSPPEFTCKEFDFYDTSAPIREFGWVASKFVSDTALYVNNRSIDGKSQLDWRQGLKHDLSSIMELQRINRSAKEGVGWFVNGLNSEIQLEEDLVYPLLKSSDLKEHVISQSRKYTIVSQQKVGQDTSYIRYKHPKTYEYLSENREMFERRKSVIYNNKPEFSIFGIGEYSFTPYKVAISGLYKTIRFSLIVPLNGKPVMLDDTCYMLGFSDLDFAVYTFILLNSDIAKGFLEAISFTDAKRRFTKDILMRIDLNKLAQQFSQEKIIELIHSLNAEYNLDASPDKWEEYKRILNPLSQSSQLKLF